MGKMANNKLKKSYVAYHEGLCSIALFRLSLIIITLSFEASEIQAVLTSDLSDVAVPIGQRIYFVFGNDGRTKPVLNKRFEFTHNIQDYNIIFRDACVSDYRSCSVNAIRTANGVDYTVQIDNAQPSDAGTYYVQDNNGFRNEQTSYAECTVYDGEPEFRVTLVEMEIEVEWRFRYWGNATINIQCQTSSGINVIDTSVNNGSRVRTWLLSSSNLSEEYRCVTTILPSKGCQNCTSIYTHQLTLSLGHLASLFVKNSSLECRHLKERRTLHMEAEASDQLVVISPANMEPVRHGDVVQCSSRQFTSAAYRWFVTSSDSDVATVYTGQLLTIDVCRITADNLLDILGSSNIRVSFTCIVEGRATDTNLIAAASANYTLMVDDDVQQLCSDKLDKDSQSTYDLTVNSLIAGIVLVFVITFTATFCCGWRRLRRKRNSVIPEQQYAPLQRSSCETSREPVRPIYEKLNVNVGLSHEPGQQPSHTESSTRTAFPQVICMEV